MEALRPRPRTRKASSSRADHGRIAGETLPLVAGGSERLRVRALDRLPARERGAVRIASSREDLGDPVRVSLPQSRRLSVEEALRRRGLGLRRARASHHEDVSRASRPFAGDRALRPRKSGRDGALDGGRDRAGVPNATPSAHSRSSRVATGSSSTSARCLPQYWFWEISSSDASSSTCRRRTSTASASAPSASACASRWTFPVAL